jgi:hypothetical protein
MDIGDALARLKGILGGRTTKDLLSNVDPNMLPQNQTNPTNNSITSAYDVKITTFSHFLDSDRS